MTATCQVCDESTEGDWPNTSAMIDDLRKQGWTWDANCTVCYECAAPIRIWRDGSAATKGKRIQRGRAVLEGSSPRPVLVLRKRRRKAVVHD